MTRLSTALTLVASLAATTAQSEELPYNPSDLAARNNNIAEALDDVRNSCTNAWGSDDCIEATLDSNALMSSDYTARLLINGNLFTNLRVLNDCAVASSQRLADETDLSIAEGFAICANSINEAAQSTNILPDPCLYSVLYFSTLGLRGQDLAYKQLDAELRMPACQFGA